MTGLVDIVWSTIYAGVVLLGIQFALPFILRQLISKKKSDEPQLLEKKWKKDTVYLYQMPGTATLPSVSPYCIKIETFLRLHNINYERRYLLVGRGSNGKLPFVEINGEHFADSEIIIRRLAFQFKIKEYATEDEANVGHAVACMADRHTYNIFFHYKVTHNPENLLIAMLGGLLPSRIIELFITPIVAPFVCSTIHKRLTDCFGSYSDEEYRELTRHDLTVYQDMLGSKKFLFGDKMNTADCAVFGHLAAMLYLDQHSHPNFLMLSHQFVPLREYIHRVRDTLYGSKFCM